MSSRATLAACLSIGVIVMAVRSSWATPIVGGYFANWAQYHTAPYTYTPAGLAGGVDKFDHIMYAFAYFDPSTFELIKVEEKDDEFYRQVSST